MKLQFFIMNDLLFLPVTGGLQLLWNFTLIYFNTVISGSPLCSSSLTQLSLQKMRYLYMSIKIEIGFMQQVDFELALFMFLL